MAEIVNTIIDKLASFISTEEVLVREVAYIKNELQIITDFLKDAENIPEQLAAVKTWVRLAYKIEDIIDQHQLVFINQNEFLKSILEIKEKILEIQCRKQVYNILQLKAESTDDLRNHRSSFLYAQDSDELVGIEQPRNEVFGLLNLEETDMERSVIAVVGMGGIGKSTLAWRIYEDVEVKRYFYVHAWISVTQVYSRKDLLHGMIQQIYKAAMQSLPSEVAQMDEQALICELRNFLQDKRYIVVFDDVWDQELWSYVENSLPINSKGSKVLLTTRHETVAVTWKGSSTHNYIFKLNLLSLEKAWELFYKKAFQGDSYDPQRWEEISQGIVNKCQGLPLALVTIGALLSTRGLDFNEWKKVHDNLSNELQSNTQLSNITRILLLSYNDLPHFLKPCLLYFGIFPVGSSIEYNRILKLWTAEDFIRPKDGITIEEVAKEYLFELVFRNLVQVSTWYDSGRARTFRVHDLLHEILRMKLEDLNFCQHLVAESPQVDVQSRRLSVEGCFEDASRSITSKCGVRSIFLFGFPEASTVHLSSSVLKNVYLLKVLDLQGAPLEQFPEEVGNLVLLQYLSLRFTKVKNIPRSIGKLQNLLTLDLKRCPVCELPVEIGNLRKLRNLIVYQNTWHHTLKVWVIGAVIIPQEALARLESLQKLADFNVAQSVSFMEQLCTFKELKYLAISNVKREQSVALCKAIEKLSSLESLNITVDYRSDDPLALQHINSPPSQLQRLYLVGPLEGFPNWISRLENLNKLRLRGSKLYEIPWDMLENLPSLTMLGINKDVYYGEQLVFRDGGFKKLKAMYFDHLLNLNTVEIEHGALPQIEDLLIHRSPQLKQVPLGLKYLKGLTSLKLVEMPEEFVDSLRSDGLLHQC